MQRNEQSRGIAKAIKYARKFKAIKIHAIFPFALPINMDEGLFIRGETKHLIITMFIANDSETRKDKKKGPLLGANFKSSRKIFPKDNKINNLYNEGEGDRGFAAFYSCIHSSMVEKVKRLHLRLDI